MTLIDDKITIIEHIYRNTAFSEDEEKNNYIHDTLSSYIKERYLYGNDIDDEKVFVLTRSYSTPKTPPKNEFYTLKRSSFKLIPAENLLIERTLETLNKREIYSFKKSSSTTRILSSNVVGFMHPLEKKGENVFKMKNPRVNRAVGIICMFTQKQDIENYIKEIIPTDIELDGMITNKTSKVVLCLMLEFILRYNEEKKFKNQKWFLTTEIGILNDFQKMKTNQ